MVNNPRSGKVGLKTLLLRQLTANPGRFVSGQEISHELGVTRTSIWKQVRALRNDGCRIEAMPNRGYRLLDGNDLLLPCALEARLGTRVLGRRLHHFGMVDSTQSVASSLAQRGEPHGALVIAEEQGKGRGRRGRSFFSPRGGLWFSLILRPDLEPQRAVVLPLMAGVAVGETIRALGVGITLKWPNDVLVEGRKIAGILGEMMAEMDALRHVILGIGINVNIDSFPTALEGIATSLSLKLGRRVSRSDVLCGVLERLEYYHDLLLTAGSAPVLDAWRALPNMLGRPATAETPWGVWQGTARDIDQNGALQIETPGGELKTVMAGDVRLDVGSG